MKINRSVNGLLVLFVLLIMLSAGILTIIIFSILYSIGIPPVRVITSVLSPLIAVFVSIVIGTALSAVISRRFLKPLHELIDATSAVSAGNFNVRIIESESVNEVSELIKSFNSMAAELGNVEMFRSDFINNFSHEIKTPVTSIAGFARQLENEDLTAEQRKEYTGIIISESERLTKMSTNILLLSNYENRQFVSDKQEYALDEQLRNCIILLEKQWTEKRLEMDIELEPVIINSNAEILSQLWLNLLENAVKFSELGEVLTVKSYTWASEAVTEITNRGTGISEDDLKHIFEKFYQAEKSRSSNGNGLGLAIARKAAELHGGRIEAECSGENETTFRVFLPLQS